MDVIFQAPKGTAQNGFHVVGSSGASVKVFVRDIPKFSLGPPTLAVQRYWVPGVFAHR